MEATQENNINQIASYLLIKKVSSFLLAITTGCGAFYIGYTQFSSPGISVFAGIFSGIVAILSIDILLGAVMDDLFDVKQSNVGKWLLMIFLLFMSGGATGFFAYVVGEKMGAPESVEKKLAIRNSVLTNHKDLRSSNQYNAKQIKKDIRSIAYQFKKDTAAIIANMPENHQRLYRKGLHARYMNRNGYSTLKENIGRIDTRVNQYLTDLDAKNKSLATIEEGLANMLSSDPLQNINKELAAADARAKKEGDMFKGVGWIIDVGLALSLFFSFLFARNKIVSDPTIDIPENELHRWVLDRLKNLSKKLLDSTEGADKDLQYTTQGVVKMLTSSAGLLGWIAHVISLLLSLPMRLSEKHGFTTFTPVTNHSSPTPSAKHRAIGFYSSSEPSEQQPVNSSKLAKQSSSEQAVNSGEQNAVNLGATEVSASERSFVHQTSERVVNRGGEQPVNGSGEQVVNIQVVNGEPTFHHYLKNGEVREYTRNEVSRWESKYRGEVTKIESWLRANQNSADTAKVLAKKEQLQNKRRQHQYWLGGLEQIDRIKAKK